MLASRHTQLQRRGIVLVLVLAMLGLLAVIAVSFATISGQARIGARNYALSVTRPTATDMMDFALAQLVGDTNDVRSAIRGHSLARDMYGNDGYNNGYLTLNPAINSNFLVTGVTYFPITPGDLRNGTIKCATNIPAGTNTPGANALYGYDFTRWTIRFSPNYLTNGGWTYGGKNAGKFLVGQSFEVLVDDSSGSDNTYPNVRVFYLAAPPELIAHPTPLPPATPVVSNKPLMGERSGFGSPETRSASTVGTVRSELVGDFFAVTNVVNNVTTVTTPGVPVFTANAHFPFILDGRYLRAFNGPGAEAAAKYANFRYNGQLLGGTNWVGDPNVIGQDEDYDACDLENWFLAIQSADGQVVVPSFHRPGVIRYDPNTKLTDWELTTTDARARILRPRAKDGHDRATFPDLLPDPTSGKINYDVDNDGDGITDSVWVDLGYPPRRDSRGQLVKPMFAFMVIGLNGRIPLNTAGNLAMRNGAGNPVFMHTSHLGNSPSEVDPTFALQNGSSPNINASGPYNTSSQFDNAGIQTAGFIGTDANGNPAFIPGDSTIATGPGGTGVSVNVTQLRSLLTGTRPSPSNDANWVMTNGQQFFMPNNVPDIADSGAAGIINLPSRSVAGRWGEPGGITSFFNTNFTPLEAFINPVRAGKSIVGLGVPPAPANAFGGVFFNAFATDGRDDNSNANDFWPHPPGVDPVSGLFTGGESSGVPTTLSGPGAGLFWPADYHDAAGDLSLPVERMRRFVTPIDVAGDGQVLNWTNRSDTGADSFGRVAYRRYFRPAGVPVATDHFTDPLSGTVYTAGTPTIPDVTNNRTHGYESYRNPGLGTASQRLNVYAAAPGDLDSSHNQTTTNIGGTNYPADVPGTTVIPTFNQYVNSYNGIDPSTFLYSPSPNLNEASEMNLYLSGTPTVDQPFGMGDLEWLYRGQDSDADALHSRLADLAPISFRNPIDGTRRRRLFTTETWETNSFVWAHDNTLGHYSDNSRFLFPINASYANAVANGTFLVNADASLNSLYLQNLPLVNNTPLATTTRTGPPYTTPLSAGYGYGPPINTNTSSLAHRDRKINLNYPLPVSNDPNEATRQKWIAEAYQLLKQILPPLSLDTPEELAQLSQYLVNVIDFRDPDGTMTHWQNPDVFLVPGTTGATPTAPYLAFAGTTGLTRRPPARPVRHGVQPGRAQRGSGFLVPELPEWPE